MIDGRPQELRPGYEWVPCDLCGADDAEVWVRHGRDLSNGCPGTFSVVRCRVCGLRYVNPRPDARTISQFYPPEYLPHSPQAFPSTGGRVKAALRAASKAPYRLRFGESPAVPPPPAPGASLLDLGCGAGGYLAQAKLAGWDVYGIEPDPAAAAMARDATGEPSHITVATADDVRLEPGRYDCITMWHVLEHVHGPMWVLRDAYAALRPGGVLRIGVPNAASAEARLFGRRWQPLELPRHLYHFTPETLSRYLRCAGFVNTRAVPAWFPSSISDSIDYVIEHLTGRRWRRPDHWATYYLTAPIASLSYVLGNAGIINVTAVKPATAASAQRREAA
jgi:2-polyprenyl-3-methyl-5-hydroxy-6-metoxy-1,4-benzoquinol methylase